MRRSIPAFNQDVFTIQVKLESSRGRFCTSKVPRQESIKYGRLGAHESCLADQDRSSTSCWLASCALASRHRIHPSCAGQLVCRGQIHQAALNSVWGSAEEAGGHNLQAANTTAQALGPHGQGPLFCHQCPAAARQGAAHSISNICCLNLLSTSEALSGWIDKEGLHACGCFAGN